MMSGLFFQCLHPLLSAVYPGVHSKPQEHRPPQPDYVTHQPHGLLHRAGLSTGQQLQSHTVSPNP